VGGRAALARDEREHLVEVEERGVGGGEVGGHEHVRVAGLGHPGGGDAPESRDDALGDVVEIGGALAEVAADRGELVAEGGERVVDGELRGLTGGDACGDLGLERGVLGHHGLRLEHVAGRAARLGAARLELAGDDADGLLHARGLGIGAERRGGVGGSGEGRRHTGDGTLGDAQADADSAEGGRGAHVCAPSGQAASWSVVRRSARSSSTFSAPSPSAVSVT
jgi:hypothetical protein